MSRRMHVLVVSVAMGLAGALTGAGPAAADPAIHLTPTALEQTVLRAQMPRTLGPWEQNLYGTTKNDAPMICSGTNGKPLALPKAPIMGLVGYSVSQDVSGAVYIYQYASQADADAALAVLSKTVCPDTAKIQLDVGAENIVPAEQGSDFTSAARDSIEAGISYTDTQGVKNIEDRITTQRGRAVVQTSVYLGADSATTKNLNKAVQLNRTWHKRALAAYERYSEMNFR